ncbi:MAG TPA: hypothetical protein VGX50_20645 [Longimicrobium sp.]|nr:hypothetical protein [Longimicrobium sp.]
MTLNLNALKVQTLVMAGATPIRAVTTSMTCPTRCFTDFDCSTRPEETQCIQCTQNCTADC